MKSSASNDSKSGSKHASVSSSSLDSTKQKYPTSRLSSSSYVNPTIKRYGQAHRGLIEKTPKLLPEQSKMSNSKHKTGANPKHSKSQHPIKIPAMEDKSPEGAEDASRSNKERKHDEMRVEILSKMINKLKDSWNLDDMISHNHIKNDQIKTSEKKKSNVTASKGMVDERKLVNQDTTRKSSDQSAVFAAKPWDPLVVDWLQSLKLRDADKYIEIFMENELDMNGVRSLTEQQLRAMGIVALGTVNKMMQGIAKLNQSKLKSSLDQFETNGEALPTTSNRNVLKDNKKSSKVTHPDPYIGITQVLKSPIEASVSTLSSPSTDSAFAKAKTRRAAVESKSILKVDTVTQRRQSDRTTRVEKNARPTSGADSAGSGAHHGRRVPSTSLKTGMFNICFIIIIMTPKAN